jgi:hypothetical protein
MKRSCRRRRSSPPVLFELTIEPHLDHVSHGRSRFEVYRDTQRLPRIARTFLDYDCQSPMRMTKNELSEIFDRVLRWPPEDQEKVARVIDQIEEFGSDADLSEEEGFLIDRRESSAP